MRDTYTGLCVGLRQPLQCVPVNYVMKESDLVL